MKKLRWVVRLLLGWAFAGNVAAQPSTSGPWVRVTTFPQSTRPQPYFDFIRTLQSPSAGVLFVKRDGGIQTLFSIDLLKTADNGATWEGTGFSGSRPPYTGQSVNAMWGIDGQQAWIVVINHLGNNNSSTQIQRTSTGMSGFASTLTQPGGTQKIHAVRFFSASIGVAIGDIIAGTNVWPIYRTTDGGQNWQLVALPPAVIAGPAGSLNGFIELLGTNLWMNVAGQMLHTPDMGQTWTISPAPTFWDMSFRDAQHGLAYGSGAGQPLYRTADGGTTWSLVSPTGLRRLRDLTAIPGTPGTYLSVGSTLIAGDRPGTAISYDDGQTWQDLGGTISLDCVTANQSGQAWSTDSYNVYQLAAVPLATSRQRVAEWAVYPNPTTGRIHLPGAGAYRMVSLYDALGRQCYTASLGPTEKTIDLEGVKDGVYSLRLSGGTAMAQEQRLVVVR